VLEEEEEEEEEEDETTDTTSVFGKSSTAFTAQLQFSLKEQLEHTPSAARLSQEMDNPLGNFSQASHKY